MAKVEVFPGLWVEDALLSLAFMVGGCYLASKTTNPKLADTILTSLQPLAKALKPEIEIKMTEWKRWPSDLTAA